MPLPRSFIRCRAGAVDLKNCLKHFISVLFSFALFLLPDLNRVFLRALLRLAEKNTQALPSGQVRVC